jgi:hypothetical protein
MNFPKNWKCCLKILDHRCWAKNIIILFPQIKTFSISNEVGKHGNLKISSSNGSSEVKFFAASNE